MILLALDTSTSLASLALLKEDELFTRVQPAQKEHAACLLPLIDSLLQEAGISTQQLDGIVFGCGPGSFTGLRIACSVAQGLAFARDLPVYPVSTLAAIAEEFSFLHSHRQGLPVLAVMDARMNQLYWSVFNGSEASPEQVSDAVEINVDTKGPVILAGVGFDTYRQDFSESLHQKIEAELPVYPSAAAMLRLVKAGKIQAVPAEQALPVYIRNQIVAEKLHG